LEPDAHNPLIWINHYEDWTPSGDALRLYLSAELLLLGMHYSTEVLITDEGFFFEATGKLWGVFEASLQIQVADLGSAAASFSFAGSVEVFGSTFEASGTMTMGVQGPKGSLTLTSQTAQQSTLGGFMLDIPNVGSELRIDFDGLEFDIYLNARLSIPSGSLNSSLHGSLTVGAPNPVVVIEMAYRISFQPDEGLVRVDAILTDNSYVLSKDVKLTGGFAFYSWFKGSNAGDFVVSLGGYHPKFNKPAHYPSVPRLGLNWQVNSNLSFKGQMYCALTPIAVMAGGKIEAVYNSGPLNAWFKSAMDFIMYWQPFYYNASFPISIGAQVKLDVGFLGSITFRTEMGTTVSIWGPEFSGKAKVNWSVFKFTIRFGDTTYPAPKPITWDAFKTQYIPQKDSDFTTINITRGQRSTINDWHIVDPDEFELSIDSQLPLNEVLLNDDTVHTGKDFHLAPMGGEGVNGATVDNWFISITSVGVESVTFRSQPLSKNYPKAIWGSAFKPSIKQKGTTLPLLSGVSLIGEKQRSPGFTEAIDASEFKYQDIVERDPFWQWGSALSGAIETDAKVNSKQIRQTLLSENVSKRRQSISDFFDNDTPINVEGLKNNLDAAFIGVPQTFAN
jgi:hypothetical protein